MKQGIAGRRRGLGWTQEELAARAGVSQSLVSSAERGVKIRAEFAEKIESALSSPAESARNSSEKARTSENSLPTEQEKSNDALMSSPTAHHLSAVHPVAAPRITPEVERAIGRAFDAERHTLSDLKAVERVAAELPTETLSDTDLRAFFRELVDAAAHLRADGREITAGALTFAVFASRKAAKR